MATELSMTGLISEENLVNWRQRLTTEPIRRVLSHAIIKNGVDAVAQNRDRMTEMPYAFTHTIATGAITSQNQSGRCWLFAGLNWARQRMANELKLKDFEMSQAFLMFYDKLEKANYFLESVIATREEPLDGRLVSWLLQGPLQDGGQWDMFVNLVEKYGVVPKWVMPESFHSSNSRKMNQLLTMKLREDAARLRDGSDPLSQKDAMLADIYLILVEILGEPPSHFHFEYQGDDGKFRGEYDLTPVEFWHRYGGVDLNDYVSVINAPTEDKPMFSTFTVDYLGNVSGGRPVLYLNLPMERFKELAREQVTQGQPVWFGCDVGPMSDRQSGILAPEQFDYDDTLGVEFDLSKADRLNYGESRMTHAMLLTGVNLVDGKSTRWKVENSWGKEVGHEGFFVMSDRWFDEYMYQIVVPKHLLSSAEQNALSKAPIHLPPWDPMGALA